MAINYRFRLKRDQAAAFVAANTLLLEGEIGLELDTGQIKIGDGETPWNSLGYFTTSDVPEGANLYFTDARAQAAVVAGAITDGDTTHAPSGDAVFDALEGKYDKTGGTITGSVTVEGGFTAGDTAGGTTFTFNRPGNAPAGSSIEYNSPGGRPGIIARYDANSRGDVRFYAESVRIGASNTSSQPTEFLIIWGDTYGVTSSSDGSSTLGRAILRWSEVFSVNSAINTSDAREKDNIRELTTDELAAAQELAAAGRIYQWKAALAEKGDAARLHCSPTVQSVIAIMESHGLDPFRYGFICYDEWDEQPEIRDEETGELVQEYRPAGNRYSLRPSELESFIAAGMAAKVASLEARLAALEL